MFADGFFDAGMLLQALKAREEEDDDEKDGGGEGKGDDTGAGQKTPLERVVLQARRREVGKRLRLVEY